MGAAAPVIAQVFVATATSIITSKIVTEVTGSEELGMIAGVVAGAYMGGQVGGASAAVTEGSTVVDTSSGATMSANPATNASTFDSSISQMESASSLTDSANINNLSSMGATQTLPNSSTTAQPRSLNQTSVMSAPKETGFFDSTIDWGAEKIGQGMDWAGDTTKTVVNKIGDFITGNQGISQSGNSLNTTQTQHNGFLSTALGKNSLQDLLSSDTMLKGYLYSTALEDQQEYLEEQDEKKFERIQWRSPAELKPISNIKRIV